MKNKKQAFTLVELIVVITILAILWTIAFISLQGYSKEARDSVRISDIKNIELGLEVYSVKAWKYLVPDNSIEITASGTLIWYQWNIWDRILDITNISNWWKDPLDNSYYTYYTNSTLKKYQLMGFLENQIQSNNTIFSQTIASDLTNRYPLNKWENLWIILDSITNIPIQNTWTWIDILNTTNTYKVYLNNNSIITGTWWGLFTWIYNWSETFLRDKNLASLDNSLLWYWDMETTTLSWTTLLLKDFSRNWNNWLPDWTIEIWNSQWVVWKSTRFSSTIWHIDIIDDITFSTWLTFFWYVKRLWTGISQDIFNNNQFFIRTTPAGEDINKPFEAFVNSDISPEPRVRSNVDSNIWEWYCIASTWDWNNLKIYINWELKNTQIRNITLDTAVSAQIWCWEQLNPLLWAFDWLIDEVRIYDRALSDYEIETLYNSTQNTN